MIITSKLKLVSLVYEKTLNLGSSKSGTADLYNAVVENENHEKADLSICINVWMIPDCQVRTRYERAFMDFDIQNLGEFFPTYAKELCKRTGRNYNNVVNE